MSVVGIDLGTTNTVVGCVRTGKVHVLADEKGVRLLPSVVSFHPGGDVLVGAEAKARRVIDARNTVYSHKRLIGRSWSSPEIAQARQRFAFELREGPGQGPLVHARGQDYTLPEVSAFVLKRARQIAEQGLGSPVDRAVITVPAHFNELQRASTKVAGRVAGLEVLRILNEPTAAALAYGLGRSGNERVAIYDFGGGTFDCTLLDLNGNIFEVLATAGDSFLGGDDVDSAIAERMAETFLKQTRLDATQDPQMYERLKTTAEEIKIALSKGDSYSVTLTEFAHGAGGTAIPFSFTMTRRELDALVTPLVDRTFKVTQDALGLARLSPTAFDKVILVGGSTRLPVVRQRVEAFFGKRPLDRVNPDEVVAIGAAIQAAALTEGIRRRSIPPPPGVPGRISRPDAGSNERPTLQKMTPAFAFGSSSPGGDLGFASGVEVAPPTVERNIVGSTTSPGLGALEKSVANVPDLSAAGVEADEVTVSNMTSPLGVDEEIVTRPGSALDRAPRPAIRPVTKPGETPRAGSLSSTQRMPGKAPAIGRRSEPDIKSPANVGMRTQAMPAVQLPSGGPPPLPKTTAFGPIGAPEPAAPAFGQTARMPPPAPQARPTATAPMPAQPTPRSPSVPPEGYGPPRAPSVPPDSFGAPPRAPSVPDMAARAPSAPSYGDRPTFDPHATPSSPPVAYPLPRTPSAPPGSYPSAPPPSYADAPPISHVPSAQGPYPFSEPGAYPSAPPARPSGIPLGSLPPAFGGHPVDVPRAPNAPQLTAPLLVDVTPRALVVETAGGYTDTIIPRNSKIPCERTRRFATGRDMQTVVRVRVAQGEGPSFSENTFLGEVELSGIRAAPRGAVTVSVTFEVDADGSLRVRARDVQTGQEARATLQLVGVADEAGIVAMRNRLANRPS